MRRRWLTALAFAAAGCGSGGGGTSEVLERLPDVEGPLVAVDVAALKEGLALSRDADPSQLGDSASSRRLAIAVGSAVPHLTTLDAEPIDEALDPAKIEAAASAGNSMKERATAITTEQDLDGVLDALKEAGYDRDGELLTIDAGPGEVSYEAAADSDGVLLLGSRAAVESALGDARGEPPARAVLNKLEGPVRAAVTRPAPGGSCLRAFGVADRIEGAEGELLLELTEQADVGRIESKPDYLPALLGPGAELGEAEASAKRLRVPFSYEAQDRVAPPVDLNRVIFEVPLSSLYDCG